jgi:PadR family transcriptional regulator, regulatory protein AphA
MKIEITILGLLMERNLYGYEIKKKIVEKLEDYVDIKFGSIYYAIKKAVNNGWVRRVGTEKESGNPERYVYEILPVGKKHYKKLLKQFFDQNMIHFNIDIVLMFLDFLSDEQRAIFVEDRTELIKEKLEAIRNKISREKGVENEMSNYFVLSYIEQHLKAELSWLKAIN